jgi:hypothetical protein
MLSWLQMLCIFGTHLLRFGRQSVSSSTRGSALARLLDRSRLTASVVLVSFAVRTESFTSKFVEMGCQMGYYVTEIDLSPTTTTEAVSTPDSLKLCMFKFGQ